ncbi:MAG TPA: hypothetical protein DHU89_07315 [Flavobacteriales bacterium]|nr:hypothetical protein [Flavobacteriales bacterium]|tara:strand:+ start:467 stop:1834 length:1368 start_codon:yes stop_codon:yes gene_type:complete
MKKLYTFCFLGLILSFGSLSAQDVNITFNVNMDNETVAESGVYLAGGGPDCFGNPGENAMNDDDMDGVWTITVTKPVGFTCPYTFTNGNCPDYTCKENIVGQDCATGEFSDRLLDPVTEDTIISTCFSQCSTDGTCTAPTDAVNVTFRVDVNEQGVAETDVVYITGNAIDGWCGSCTEMTDDDNDGVYEITLELDGGAVEYKYTINGWDGNDEVFDPIEDGDCTLTSGEFTNRLVTVAGEDIVLDVNCFEACGACGDVVEPTLYDVTFMVDMTNVAEDFTLPEVNGTFNDFCGNCSPLTDEGNGIWSTTIPLASGSYDFKYSADAWNIQEDLTDVTGCDIAETDGFWNRFVVVQEAAVILESVCWGECSACEVSVYEIDGLNVSIYPNPISEGALSIEGIQVNNGVVVYNALGSIVKTVPNVRSTKISIDINDLEQGVYFLKGENGVVLGSFIKK